MAYVGIYSRVQKEGLAISRLNFFDKNWNHQPFRRRYPNSQIVVERPGQLEKMIGLAEKLAKDIPFVRVDLYCVDDRIYFGEMTFTNGSGFEEISPIEADLMLGDLWKIKELDF